MSGEHGLGAARGLLTRPVTRWRVAPWRVLLALLCGVLALALVALSVRQTESKAGTPSEPAGGIVSPLPRYSQTACLPSRTHPDPLVDVPVADGAQVAQAARAGAGVVSATVSWADVRPLGRDPYDWSDLDDILSAATTRRVAVRLVLQQAPSWAMFGGVTDPWSPPQAPVELQRWARFVSDTLRHVSAQGATAAYVEVWPGPDRRRTWAGGPNATAYAALLRRTDRVVRRLAPDAEVVTGSLDGADTAYLGDLYDALAADAAPGHSRLPFDAVGVQPGGATDLSRNGFLGYRAVHALMVRRSNGGAPLYLTGVGAAAAPSASDLVAALGATDCASFVEAVSPAVPTGPEGPSGGVTGRPAAIAAVASALRTRTAALDSAGN